MKHLKKPQAVMFDWDGTIVDSNDFFNGKIEETLAEMGITEWDKVAQEKYKYCSARVALPLVFGERWQEIYQRYITKIAEANHKGITILPGVVELIQAMYKREIKLFVISNKNATLLREEVRFFGLHDYFIEILGAEDAAEDKPSPAPVFLAMEQAALPRTISRWFIGDAAVDMECAHASGCVPILFTNSRIAPSNDIVMEMKQKSINCFSINDYNELISLI